MDNHNTEPILSERSAIISDPLAWQEAMDNAPASINMRGSMRFWNTVAAMGLEVVYRDGAPEFSEIVFRLEGKVGLRLFIRDTSAFIRFEFCEIED